MQARHGVSIRNCDCVKTSETPHTRQSPFSFLIMCIGAAQGLLDGRHMPSSTNWWKIVLAAASFSGFIVELARQPEVHWFKYGVSHRLN